MPLSSSLVGLESKPYASDLEDRWAMNYAAGINDADPTLYDTRRAPLVVHPMYLAHPEWEASKLLMTELGLTPAELGTSVEMSHDTVVHRTLVSGLSLTTSVVLAGVERHRAGALATMDLVTREQGGDEVGRSRVVALYRGVEVHGEDRPAPALSPHAPELPESADSVVVPIPATACHTYSECARIWNAFHTDVKVAEATGISGLILHGTATLAIAVSRLCQEIPDLRIGDVRRISADLRAMVFAPSTTSLHFAPAVEGEDGLSTVAFALLTEEGGKALTRGAVSYQPLTVEDHSKEGSR